MSKSGEEYMSTVEDKYDEFVEEQRQVLRKEGAEELRRSILSELTGLKNRSWTAQEKIAYDASMIVVERTTI